MDPFNKLPAELRLQIFVQLRSERYISQLIQASPVMLEQYTPSKAYISRGLLASDLDDNMMQDAMGIILFPSSGPYFLAVAHRHFYWWATQQLPDPFKKHNQGLFDELGKLHNRLMFFIEDYLTKATAIFPPRQYLCLPDLSSVRGHLVFKGQTVSTRFDAADLTDPERKGLLRAFLRYELICKIFHLRGGDRILPQPGSLYKYGGRKFQPLEREAIGCVHGYLESLYGAMFAQCSDSWLPDIPVGSLSSHTTGLLYPDNIYVNADCYALDMGLQGQAISSSLASFGFNLATTFLRPATAGRVGRDRLKRWFMDHYKTERDRVSTYRIRLGDQFLDEGPKEIKDKHFQENPGMCQVLYPRLLNSSSLHRNIYRQRAWVFLDDARFYPSSSAGPHFPTCDDLDEMSGEIRLDVEWFTHPIPTRALHRSQKWHDKRLGESSSSKGVTESQDSELKMECKLPLPDKPEEVCFGNLAPFWR